MNNNNRNALLASIGFIILVLVIVIIYLNKGYDWTEDYEIKKEKPYGSYVIKNIITDLFPKSIVSVNSNQSVANFTKTHKLDTYTNYVYISNYCYLDSADSKLLLDFANKGGNVMFICNSMPETFCSHLPLFNQDSLDFGSAFNEIDTPSVYLNFSNPKFELQKDVKLDYWYKNKKQFYNWTIIQGHIFDNYNGGYEVEGQIGKKWLNFIRVYPNSGKGNIYFHTTPIAFSNYYLRSLSHLEYAEKVLSHLPNGNTILDLHSPIYSSQKINYKDQSPNNSPLRFVLSNRSLKWAWYLLWFTVILYVLSAMKRKQKFIPILASKRNTTLSFVTTLGTLYFRNREYKKICIHQMRSFTVFIREKYFISNHFTDPEFVTRLSVKSGVDPDIIKQIVNKYSTIWKNSGELEKADLLEFYQLIKAFYNQCK